MNYKKIINWVDKNDKFKKINNRNTKHTKHIDQSKFAICSAGQISHEINARSKNDTNIDC